jgi:hypothetical protein
MRRKNVSDSIAVSLIEPRFVNTPISQSSRTAPNPLKQYDTVRPRAGEALARSVKEGVAPSLVADGFGAQRLLANRSCAIVWAAQRVGCQG